MIASPGLGSKEVGRSEKGLAKGEERLMRPCKRMFASGIATTVTMLAALGGMALAAQDKYTVQVPGGLAFSDFRGYEDWQAVAVSQTEDLLKLILANPAMIDAYRSGVPGNGKPFPDGSKIAKIQWKPKQSEESPFAVNVPNTLASIGFIEKDSKRFPDTGGWGYAEFSYDPASDTYAPDEQYVGDAKCGYECHTIVSAKDYIFTAYQKR